jgi:polyphosphate kinase
VLAIKQTIYRAGSNSPIVAALSDAARSGKQVSVQVELKARFDEENNIEWARALERAGAHVVYGDVAMKTHAKLLMIVRQDADGIRRYLHLGTGNYNVRTAEQYTDLGLLTCDADLAEDVTDLFNALTGYSVVDRYRKLLVSPGGIRAGVVERIQRSAKLAEGGAPAQIIFKMNSLTDRKCIDALYKASQAGVRINLIIRGSCCLVPGVPGLSENITVTSIVGRFLEHSRLFCFSVADDDWEVWLGSADLMERNLDRRVESLFPILDPVRRKWITSEYLPAYMRDVAKSRTLTRSGAYERAYGDGEGQWWNAQEWFMQFAERQTLRQQRSMGLRKQKVSD